MAKFQPGNPGRPKGSRNKLHKDVLDAYAATLKLMAGT